MSTRTRYTAEYLYPGVFMPEETYRDLTAPTLEAALAVAPDEDGYFRRDGWYAVRIRTIVERRYVADDGKGEAWLREGQPATRSFIVGERVHWEDLPDDDEHRILRSNIRSNSKDGHGVRTRCGNWQFSSDWDEVVSPAAVSA